MFLKPQTNCSSQLGDSEILMQMTYNGFFTVFGGSFRVTLVVD